jgi:hypothetical protein
VEVERSHAASTTTRCSAKNSLAAVPRSGADRSYIDRHEAGSAADDIPYP